MEVQMDRDELIKSALCDMTRGQRAGCLMDICRRIGNGAVVSLCSESVRMAMRRAKKKADGECLNCTRQMDRVGSLCTVCLAKMARSRAARRVG